MCLAGVLLAVYTVAVLVVTMWPTPVDQGYRLAIDEALFIAHRHGVPGWFGYNALEFTANIVMFAPLGFLFTLALPRRLWWLVLVVMPAFSTAIELAQGSLLPHRVEALSDIASNSIGGWLGALGEAALRAIVGARDKTVLRRAIWEYERTRSAAPLGK